MQQTALLQAKETAQIVSMSQSRAEKEAEINLKLENVKKEREVSQANLERLKKLRNNLFVMESSSRPDVEQAITQVEKRLEKIGCETPGKEYRRGEVTELLDELVRVPLIEELHANHPKLSLEPLRWRDKNGLPRLVPFNARNGFMIYPGEPVGALGERIKISPELPKEIGACYADMADMIFSKGAYKIKRTWRNFLAEHRRCFYCEFKGIIPEDVREKILAHESRFRDLGSCGGNVFIIAEPKDPVLQVWDEEHIQIQKILVDPLAVAYYPKIDPQAFWLIADFDTTTVEQSMLTHFS